MREDTLGDWETEDKKKKDGREAVKRSREVRGTRIWSTEREHRFALEERAACVPEGAGEEEGEEEWHLPRAGRSKTCGPEEPGNQLAQLCAE